MRVLIFALALLAIPAPALAIEGTLDGLGNDLVAIWKSADARSKGTGLLLDGVHKRAPDLLLPYIACFVTPGTRVVTTSVGFISHDILIVEGPQKGCAGNIEAEKFKRAR